LIADVEESEEPQPPKEPLEKVRGSVEIEQQQRQEWLNSLSINFCTFPSIFFEFSPNFQLDINPHVEHSTTARDTVAYEIWSSEKAYLQSLKMIVKVSQTH
jgi:hypothetical protein